MQTEPRPTPMSARPVACKQAPMDFPAPPTKRRMVMEVSVAGNLLSVSNDREKTSMNPVMYARVAIGHYDKL